MDVRCGLINWGPTSFSWIRPLTTLPAKPPSSCGWIPANADGMCCCPRAFAQNRSACRSRCRFRPLPELVQSIIRASINAFSRLRVTPGLLRDAAGLFTTGADDTSPFEVMSASNGDYSPASTRISRSFTGLFTWAGRGPLIYDGLVTARPQLIHRAW